MYTPIIQSSLTWEKRRDWGVCVVPFFRAKKLQGAVVVRIRINILQTRKKGGKGEKGMMGINVPDGCRFFPVPVSLPCRSKRTSQGSLALFCYFFSFRQNERPPKTDIQMGRYST